MRGETDNNSRKSTPVTDLAVIKEKLNWHNRVGWGAIAAAIGAFIWLLNFYIPNQLSNYSSKSDISSLSGRIDTLSSKVDGLSSDLNKLETSILNLRIQAASSNPTNKRSQGEVIDALKRARDKAIVLPSNTVAQVGQSFVHASEQQPSAWSVGIEFIVYRSYLNSLTPPDLIKDSKPLPAGTFWYFLRFYTKLNEVPQILRAGGVVSKDEGARLEELGQPLNANVPIAAALLILRGGVIRLDGMRMKNVVLQNVAITYEGGPINLENVYFLNCTFAIKHAPKGRELSVALLNPAPISVSIPNS